MSTYYLEDAPYVENTFNTDTKKGILSSCSHSTCPRSDAQLVIMCVLKCRGMKKQTKNTGSLKNVLDKS